MDEAEQARAYAEADFSEANERFLELFDLLHPEPFEGTAVDLGCGPADIPLRFAHRHPGACIDAVDGAPAMLALAGQALEQSGLEVRIRLHCHHLPATALPRGAYDAVLSNSLLHHLKDPDSLWHTLRHCAAPGAAVLVMDLLRPLPLRRWMPWSGSTPPTPPRCCAATSAPRCTPPTHPKRCRHSSNRPAWTG